MPDDRPGAGRPRSPRQGPHRRRPPRVQPIELAAAQRLVADWWRLTLHRFRDYIHAAGPVRPDAAREDADDLDR